MSSDPAPPIDARVGNVRFSSSGRGANPRVRVHHVARALAILKRSHPDAACALDHTHPLELLVATVLAAQCTDARVNQVTQALFKKYRTAGDYAQASLPTLEREIHSTGFYTAKAKALKGIGEALVKRFNGRVPRTMEELTSLPGVGRKTANVVLGVSFGIPGIIVDTHVKRLAYRLGWTSSTDPEKIEQDLMPLVSRRQWTRASHLITFHGRRVCRARTPECHRCPIAGLCPKRGIPKATPEKRGSAAKTGGSP